MKLSIVLSVQPTRFEAVAFKGEFERNVARIAEMGYEGIELAIRDPRQVDGEELARTLERYGLAVPAIGTGQAWGEEHLSFTDPDPAIRMAAIERIKSHIPFAARTGASCPDRQPVPWPVGQDRLAGTGGRLVIIGLVRGVLQGGVDQAQAMAWLVAALQECCKAAASQGVRLALEPLNRYETPLVNTVAQGLKLIEQVGADNLGLLLDTFHMNIEEPSIEGSIQQAGDRIFHFHVADSNRWHPGAGHLDFRSILEALLATSYDGFVSGEFMPLPDADTAAQRGIAWLRGLGL